MSIKVENIERLRHAQEPPWYAALKVVALAIAKEDYDPDERGRSDDWTLRISLTEDQCDMVLAALAESSVAG